LYKKGSKLICKGCGEREVKKKDSGCYLGQCCGVCCKKIGRKVSGAMGERIGVCGAHVVKGVEPVLGRYVGGDENNVLGIGLLRELNDMGMLVYIGVFGDFKSVGKREGGRREGWVEDANLHATIFHKSKMGDVGVKEVKMGKVGIVVGDVRENDEYRVGRVSFKDRQDLTQLATELGQKLHVTLGRREDVEARGSVELLDDGVMEGAKRVEGYVGVCLELPNGVRTVCKNREEIQRAKCAGTYKQYESRAKVLLTGHGADEQLGGYGRHRSRYVSGGYEAVKAELDMEMGR